MGGMGRALRVVLLAAALIGCAGVEGDLKRAEMREGLRDLVRGRDRGVAGYRQAIVQSTTQSRAMARYQYAPPAHISHWLVQRSVRGLGGTRLNDAQDLAVAVDTLLDVVARDPTAAMRAVACYQLGRILLRLPAPAAGAPETTPQAEAKIHEIALDLLRLREAAAEGEQVKIGEVVERLQALSRERPQGLRSAREVVRALASRPIAGTASQAIRTESNKLAPPLIRASVISALAEVACGRQGGPDPADESPLVRAHAVEVLTRIAAGDAREVAALRLPDPIDPAERDGDVRRHLTQYLGEVGGEAAFRACVVRLDDSDSGVRYHAQAALVRMTGARVAPTAAAWNAYRAAGAGSGGTK